MACVRCGDDRDGRYVRLDTVGLICVPCLIEEIHELREQVAELQETIDGMRALKNATQ